MKENKFVNYFKENYKTILYGVSFYVAFLLSFFFGQMVNANDGSFGNGLTPVELSFFYISILLSYAYFFYISYRNNVLRFDKKRTIAAIVCGVIFLYLTLVVSITNYSKITIQTREPFEIRPLDRIASIMDTSIMCLFVFSIICVLPNLKGKDFMMRFFCFGLLAFVFSGVIYSLATEFWKYQQFKFTTSFFIRDDDSLTCYSFFAYGNVYGHLLFFGVLGFLYLGYSYKQWWLYVLGILLGLLIPYSFCRGGFVCYLILIFCLLIYFIYWIFKKNKIAGYVSISIFGLSLTWLFVETFAIHSIQMTFVRDGVESVHDLEYILNLLGERFLDNRQIITKWYLERITTPNIIFGTGIDLLDYIVRMDGNFNLHNGLYTIFFTGGPLFALVYLAMYGYTFYLLIKIFKRDKRFFLIYFVMLVPSILYQLSESFPSCFPVFGGGVIGMMTVASVHLKAQEEDQFAVINRFW